MPLSIWAQVPAKTSNIESASRITVSRSDANGATSLLRRLVTGLISELYGSQKFFKSRQLLRDRVGRALKLEIPHFRPIHYDRHAQSFGRAGEIVDFGVELPYGAIFSFDSL